MTAEVAIINRQAVALAADSAVTIGRERVWKYANKLFSAGPHNDIVVMIYNTGDFLGVPWEVVVKEHRRRCRNTPFSSLLDFAHDLISFLKSPLFSNDEQEEVSIYLIIVDICENLMREMKPTNRRAFDEKFAKLVNHEISSLEKDGEALDEQIPEADFIKKFTPVMKALAKDIFGYIPRKNDLLLFFRLVYTHFSLKSESEYASGLVIAGYGRNEIFPSVYNFVVDGRWRSVTRVWQSRSVDFNEANPPDAGILPFAQSDMASLFVEGVYPRYRNFLEAFVEGTLNDKSDALIKDYVKEDEVAVEKARQRRDNRTITEELLNDFRAYRQNSFVDPLMKTVSALPKEEMAFMAKAIVELTALRRKFTSTVETVGGAIDVAIISKGDGFIWIDRKHYFDMKYNPDFRERKVASRGGGDASGEQAQRADERGDEE